MYIHVLSKLFLCTLQLLYNNEKLNKATIDCFLLNQSLNYDISFVISIWTFIPINGKIAHMIDTIGHTIVLIQVDKCPDDRHKIKMWSLTHQKSAWLLNMNQARMITYITLRKCPYIERHSETTGFVIVWSEQFVIASAGSASSGLHSAVPVIHVHYYCYCWFLHFLRNKISSMKGKHLAHTSSLLFQPAISCYLSGTSLAWIPTSLMTLS